jgi:hypothetical protein
MCHASFVVRLELADAGTHDERIVVVRYRTI